MDGREKGTLRAAVSMSSPAQPLAIFLHDGAWDRMHQGLSIAAAGAALGRRVDVYLFWWALERVAQDRLDEPDLGEAREDHADRLEARGVPTLRELLGHLKESGTCTVYACTGSLSALGLRPPDVEEKVDALVGWTAILQRTQGITDRFYL